MSKQVSLVMVGGYLTPAELNDIYVSIFRGLPDRISIADKIGIAAMVIDEVNGVIDRMADQKAGANEEDYASQTTAS